MFRLTHFSHTHTHTRAILNKKQINEGSEAASVTGKYGEYLTPAEARDVLLGYIRAEDLDHPTVRQQPKREKK